MRSRRSFIGAAIGTTGLLAGCIGQLGNGNGDGDDSGNSDDSTEDEYRVRPTVSINVWPQVQGNEVGVIARLADAEALIIEADGREIERLSGNTDEEVVVAENVEEGTNIEAIAVYADGDREPVADRCYSC